MAARTRRPYAPEFKAEAVRLARTSGQPRRVTARALGVSVGALRAWVKRGAIDAGERAGPTTDERGEVHRRPRARRGRRPARAVGADSAPAPPPERPFGRAEAAAIIAEARRIVTPHGVERLEPVRIGGIDQWVSIRGADRGNPVLLHLHGGPGYVSLPMSWWFGR